MNVSSISTKSSFKGKGSVCGQLASLSASTKRVTTDEKYKQPMEFFSMELNKTMCRGYAEDNNIKVETLLNASDYCQSVMMRYIHLLDKATFMPAEHIQKEREYGIIWRSAFKREMKELIEGMVARCVSSDGFTEKYDNEFHLLHKVIKTDAIDAATFDEASQADLIHMLVENLEVLEKTTLTI